MSYQRERDQFIATVTREGLPLHAAEALLRAATGINRRAELACSSEAADRDRVPCPASELRYGKPIPGAPCLCDDYPVGDHAKGIHHKIPRITLQDWQAEERLRKLLAAVGRCECGHQAGDDNGHEAWCNATENGWQLVTSGDPRGYTLRVMSPAMVQRNQAKVEEYQREGRKGYALGDFETIGVPARESGIKW